MGARAPRRLERHGGALGRDRAGAASRPARPRGHVGRSGARCARSSPGRRTCCSPVRGSAWEPGGRCSSIPASAAGTGSRAAGRSSATASGRSSRPTTGATIVVAHLHASHDRRESPGRDRPRGRARGRLRADDLLRRLQRREHPVEGFSAPIPGVDQILVRGLELESGPTAWPKERRPRRRRAALGSRAGRGGGRVTLEEIRAELPVLEHTAYLNAGTFGPLPRRRPRRQVLWSLRALAEGRSGHAFFEEVLDMRVRLREAVARADRRRPGRDRADHLHDRGLQHRRRRPAPRSPATSWSRPTRSIPASSARCKAWGLELRDRRGVEGARRPRRST